MPKYRYLLAFSMLLLTYTSFSQSFSPNRPIPLGIYPYQYKIKKADNNFHQYILVSPFLLNAPSEAADFVVPKPMILDENGYIAWFVPNATGKVNSDFKYFEATHQFAWTNTAKNGATYYLILDAHLQIIDTIRNTPEILPDGHDFLILENGNYLIGGKSYKIYDKKKGIFVNEVPDNETKIKALGYVLQEFDKDKKLVFQWDSNDFLFPKDFVESYEFNVSNFDYCHGNAFVQDKNGNFLVSFRNFDAVCKIDRKTGNVVWKLGGKSNQFTFTNDKGFSGQHYIRILPNGNITLYDNATQAVEPKISRAVEYQIDTIKMTATKTWEFKEQVFGKSLGSYQNYVGKYHLINYGFVFRPSHNMSLVNENQEVLAHLFFKDSVMTYRAEIADIQKFIHRPKITVKKVKQGIELSAPKNYSQYLWSNGAKTQKIVVSEKGEYQVWTPQGIGMSGSLPFIFK